VVALAWGEIWWTERPEEGPRPYLILTRDEAIPVLSRVLAAPVTRTIRSIPTELLLGTEEGLQVACVASLDNITVLPKGHMTRRMGALARTRRHELCQAIAAAVGC